MARKPPLPRDEHVQRCRLIADATAFANDLVELVRISFDPSERVVSYAEKAREAAEEVREALMERARAADPTIRDEEICAPYMVKRANPFLLEGLAPLAAARRPLTMAQHRAIASKLSSLAKEVTDAYVAYRRAYAQRDKAPRALMKLTKALSELRVLLDLQMKASYLGEVPKSELQCIYFQCDKKD